MSVEDAWEAIHDWLAFHHPTMLGLLNGPADFAAFAPLEEKIGHKLPDAFKESYLIHDGSDYLAGILIGCPLMPLKEVARCQAMWADIAGDTGLVEELSEDRRPHPPGAVRALYANRNWLPFAGDSQHYIAIDFDPDTGGVPGQIINAGRDDETLHVIANSFEEFMVFVASQFTAGRVKLMEDADNAPPRWLSVEGAKHDLITGLPYLLGLRDSL